jgi:hypothetical protein
MSTLTRMILKNIGPEWQSFQDFYPPMRHRVDGASVLKKIQNLVAGGVLEQLVSGGSTFYRAPKPTPSREKTGQELTDYVLKWRSENGYLREGDIAYMRQAMQKVKRQETQELNSLEEKAEEPVQDWRVPGLSYEDFKRILGLPDDD